MCYKLFTNWYSHAVRQLADSASHKYGDCLSFRNKFGMTIAQNPKDITHN